MSVYDNVFVPSYAVQSGGLPGLGVCGRHGRPPVRVKTRSYYSRTPPWMYLVLLFSLLIGLLLMLLLRKKVTGPVADCAVCVHDQQVRVRWLGAALATTVLLFGYGIAAASGGGVLLSVLAGFATLVTAVAVPPKFQQGTVSNDGVWVEMKKPAPAFALAVHSAMQAHTAAPQPAQAPLTPAPAAPAVAYAARTIIPQG